jgi:uridine monophosphate synthetase
MPTSFVEKLTEASRRNDSLLCSGLDPDPGRIPADFQPDLAPAERLRRWCLDIVAQTSDLVCCYKPNFAFFEQYGPAGLAVMRDVIAAIPDPVPVLLDAKRGDIGNTAKAYARAAFEVWGADAITISPYLGRDSVDPFLAYAGKMAFLLCQTSNASAAEVQNYGGEPLYRHIARQGQTWGDADQVGFVVGATKPEALAEVRALAPDRWLLAPGIGAQGGDLGAALGAGLTGEDGRVIVPVSRAILYADDPRAVAQRLRDRINAHRADATDPQVALIQGLYEAGCLRFGEFTLASGKTSPIYVDLRRTISYPRVFEQVVEAYSRLLASLSFERLAPVPYAALPAGSAVALKEGHPLVYPRKEAKSHGTGRTVEGVFAAGQVTVPVEDVITSGGSLLRAIETLESAGLVVNDVVVLVDREQGGRARLQEHGYRLHAVLTLGQILDTLRDENIIDAQTYQKVKRYLEQDAG